MEYFLIALVGLAVLLSAAVFSRRTGIAAPLLLLAVGLAAGYAPGVPRIDLEPEWILTGVLPPLLYASSVRLPMIDLRRNLGMVIWLSIVMVVASALAVGFVVHRVAPQIPLGLAIALGAVVSPTDAVAATAIGKRTGLPHRLMTVLEGESLVNDASALVTLRSAIAVLGGAFSWGSAVGSFVWSVAMGVALGMAAGRLGVWVRCRLGDPVLSTTVSFVVPFVAFFSAEELHASGIIAVVLAGLVTGKSGARHLSASERTAESVNWATANFLLENAVFLVMGLQLPGLVEAARADGSTTEAVWLSALVLGVLVVVRASGLLVALAKGRHHANRRDERRAMLEARQERLADFERADKIDADRAAACRRRFERARADLDFAESEPIGPRSGAVLTWAGMRGVVTLAAALTIPGVVDGRAVPHRDEAVLVAFNVAVASLVLFGATLPALIRRLDLPHPSPADRTAEVSALIDSLTATVADRLGPIEEQEYDGQRISPEVADMVASRIAPLIFARSVELIAEQPDARQVGVSVQQRYLQGYRQALAEEQAVGAYSTESLQFMARMLDSDELRMPAAR